MAVGSWAKFTGSGTDDTVLSASRNTWVDWDHEGGSGWVETDADALVSESASNFTLAEAGYYLIIYRIHHDASHNNRLTMKTRCRGGSGGTTIIEGSQGSGYERNNNNDELYMQCAFIHKAAANDIIDLQYNIDVSDGTEAGFWDASQISISFIRLTDSADSAYGIYADSQSTGSFLNGTTDVAVDFNTVTEETDTGVIERTAANDWTLKETARYLVCYDIVIDITVGRTQRIGHAELNSSVIPASHTYVYLRDADNGLGVLTCMFIVDATANDVLHFFGQRGIANIDGTATRVANEGGMMIMRIHDDTELIACRDGTALQDQDGGLSPYDVNVARNIITNDSAAFTAPAITDINCVKAMDVLCWATVAGASPITEASGTRLSIEHHLELAGTDLLYGQHGSYQRNNQASADTMNNCSHPYGLESVTAGQDFQCEFTDDGDNGGTSAVTGVDEVGIFAINLDSLAPVGGAPPRELFQGIVNQSGMI